MKKYREKKHLKFWLKSGIKTTRGLKKGISRKDPKGEGEQAQQNNPGKDFQKYICDKIAIIGFKTISCKHNTAIIYKYYHIIRREQKKKTRSDKKTILQPLRKLESGLVMVHGSIII